MPRNARTARGDLVDFDTIIIKNQLAQAPMNVEVQRRRELIEAKEKVRGQKTPTIQEVAMETVTTDPATVTLATPDGTNLSDEAYEPEAPVAKLAGIEPVPNIPVRKK